MNYDMKRSGAYIQKLRVQSGYSQGEMAKELHMDRSYLSRIEAGRKGCSVDLFILLSEFFHVPMDSLVLGTDRSNTLKNEDMAQLKKEIAELIERLTTLQTRL